MWFEGFWWWVCPSGQPTSSQQFALWNVTGEGFGTVIPDSVVTSGELTAGQWNWVPLSAPVQLAIGTSYNACTGFTGGFPNTNDQFGAGAPFAVGIVNGPLSAYSDTDGSLPPPYGMPQGAFGTAGTDPSANMAAAGSNSANFWVDVQVSSDALAGYSGSYRLWPNKYDASPTTSGDSAVNYVVATEVHLNQTCTLDKIWYYSPVHATQLATECGVWDISSRQLVAENKSPSWSGVAASGWVSCAITGTTLPAGQYKVAVYNGAADPVEWSPKQLNYWDTGVGRNGITNGPLYAPSLADAATADIYQGSGQEPGQSTFAAGPPDRYPHLYVDGLAQNYWVDLEVTPGGTPTISPDGATSVNSGAFLSFFP
jgi:hypothetical protein